MSTLTSTAAAPRDTTSVGPPDARGWLWRVRHLAVSGLFVAVCLNSDPGTIVADTKLDLVLDPGSFLERAMHLWDPLGSAGQLQDQAYGYLVPMGPFFAVAHALTVPGWVTQRLWWALILVVAYLGFVALARRLRIGTEWTRLIAGVGFALAPHVLSIMGRASVEAWPTSLAPWVLVPLVGSAAHRNPRRAAALSGLAVLAMGGVNAAVDLAALLPAGLWLVSRRWSRDWLRLTGWWVLAVTAATLWWVVPLLVLGRYSPPFLDYIESASITTSTTTLTETLRGTADWVAYLGELTSRAGFALLTQPLLIVFTVLGVALGLVGLAWQRTTERLWLVLMLLAGVALVTLGHIGPVDGVAADSARRLLDGALAPLRNVHKFDLLIRLSLSLGMASALSVLSRGRTPAESRFLRRVVAGAGAFVVVGAAAPFLGLRMANPGSFAAVPAYWPQASGWLTAHGAAGRTLLVPGSRFADYTWGTASDEPLQSLAGAPWDVRSAIPLSNAGHIRWLDSLERRIADGQGGSDLAGSLTDGGVRYLVVRNDLSYGPAGATRPLEVHSALSDTPGVSLVASFGPPTGGGSTPDLLVDGGLSIALPALQVYEVQARPDLRASLEPTSAVGDVVGSAESVGGDGLVDLPVSVVGDATTALTSTVAEAAAGPRVLTDSPRRREVNFGIGTFGASQTLAPEDPLRISKPARDYGAGTTPGDLASARLGGVASISASSSASDADSYPRSDPAAMPYAAFDGTLSTGWRPNPIKDPVGSWLAVDFGRSVALGGGEVVLDAGTSITRLSVRTDQGVLALVPQDGRVALPSESTTHLTLTISGVAGTATQLRSAGVREVSVPGVVASRTVVLPDDPWPGGPDRVALSGDAGHGSCLVIGQRPLCAVGAARVGEDAAGLDRTFSLPVPLTASVTMTARPLPTPALTAAVTAALDLPVRVRASSVAVADVAASALSAVDGDLGTAWLASATDPDPSLTLSWDGSRSVDRVQVLVDQYAPVTRPTHVRITSSAGTREADLDAQGWATFAPLRTSSLTLHLSSPRLASAVDAYTVAVTPVGIGVSDVRIEGVTPELTFARTSLTNAVHLGCGAGPALRIDGVDHATQVDTTVGALLRGTPVPVTMCAPGGASAPPSVTLPAGTSRVQAGTPGTWAVSSVVLERVGAPAATRPSVAQPVIGQWGATERTLQLGPRSTTTLLAITENANAGWVARLDGHTLRAVTVNGWQQGFVVPSGAAGTVRLTFAPDATFRAGLAGGAVLAVLLLVGALVPGRRRAVQLAPAGRRHAAALGAVAVLGIPVAAGWWGTALAVLVVLAGIGLRLRGLTRPWMPPAAAAVLVLAAGAVLVRGHWGGTAYLADRPLDQLLSATALSVTVLSLWWRPPRRHRRSRPEPPGPAVDHEPGGLAGSAAAPGSGS